MSRINLIQQKILELSPGDFQKLGDSYFHSQGYDNLVAIGSVIGANKTRTNTPDTLFLLKGGKYAYVEYTTQQENVFKKYQGDLGKCLDESKTGIPIDKIQEIIFCYTSELESSQIEHFRTECQNNGISFVNVGMGKLSNDLLLKYQFISKEFLNIDIDKGQILSLDEFIQTYQRHRLSTPLDTRFYFRDNEIKSVFEKISFENLVFIEGKPGVGKTRLAVECCRMFINENPDYNIKCIYYKGLDLFEDIKIHFSQPGKYLVLIDDANRVTGFKYILDLIHNTQSDVQIKIVATVRDYAVSKIIDKTEPYTSYGRIAINLFDRKEMDNILINEFGIKNNSYLERIWEISKGNARLAIMAAKTAAENTLFAINDSTKLYDEYFKSIKNDIDGINEDQTLLAACAIALFRVVDRSSSEQMLFIEDAFGVDQTTFWKSVEILNDLEIVDLYENEVVKYSDQILSTYLFYLVLFRRKSILLSSLLEKVFPIYIEKLKDSLTPVINTFYSAELLDVLRKEILVAHNHFKSKNDSDNTLRLLESFSFVLQTETLVYIKTEIEATKKEDPVIIPDNVASNSFTPTPSILSLMEKFISSDPETLRVVFKLLLVYVNKKPSIIPNALHIITTRYGFTHRSHLHGYYVQKTLCEVVIEEQQKYPSEVTNFITFKLIEHYLSLEYNNHEMGDSRSVNIYTFSLAPDQYTFQLRQILWMAIFNLFKNNKTKKYALVLLDKYAAYYINKGDKSIVENDMKSLIPFVKSKMNRKTYHYCSIVQNLLDKLDDRGILYDAKIRKQYYTEHSKIKNILFTNVLEMKSDKLGWDDYRKIKLEKIRKLIKGYTFNKLKQLIGICIEIYETPNQNRDQYQIQSGAVELFEVLSEVNPKQYLRVVKYYISLNNPLKLQPYQLVYYLLKIAKAVDVKKIILDNTKGKMQSKNQRQWLFAYFSMLSEENITKTNANDLIKLYSKADYDDAIYRTDYLLKYQKKDSQIIVKICELVLFKSKKDKKHLQMVSMLFNPHTNCYKQLSDIFKDNVQLLKHLYFALYDGSNIHNLESTFQIIYRMDNKFLYEYLDMLYSKNEYVISHEDHINYTFLWLFDDYENRIQKIMKYIQKKESLKGFSSSLYVERIFMLMKGEHNWEEVTARQKRFLENQITKNHSRVDIMLTLFGIISSYDKGQRHHYVQWYLKYNKKVEHFKRLQLEPNSWSAHGSWVPVIQRRIDYFQEMLQYLTDVDLLAHKLFIEERIEGLKEYMNYWKKRDFLED